MSEPTCYCGNPNDERFNHGADSCPYKHATMPPAPEHNGACNCICGCREPIEEGPYCLSCAHGIHEKKAAQP